MLSAQNDRRKPLLLLGVDGGGTRCRARLADLSGKSLGEGQAGPANIRLGLQESLAAVAAATGQCLQQAGLSERDCRIVACLALAGACEPSTLTQAQASPLPFYQVTFTSDARAACIGAHAGSDGGIIIIGTGSIGWGLVGGHDVRVGGWGFPVSDQGSGAWLGCEALRQVLRARDGLIPWTNLLTALFEQFQSDAYAIVRWMSGARPRDYASLAPAIIAHAEQGDDAARELLTAAAVHIEAIAARLIALGTIPLSLTGGLAEKIRPLLSDQTRSSLVPAMGDAVSGALHLARAEACRLNLVPAKANA